MVALGTGLQRKVMSRVAGGCNASARVKEEEGREGGSRGKEGICNVHDGTNESATIVLLVPWI
jgi:hypothetical protein